MDSGSQYSSDGNPIRYAVANASREDLSAHLVRCDPHFVPRLSERLDIVNYAQKIHDKALTFEAWNGGSLVGLVAAYMNDPDGREAYVTNVSVEAAFQGMGVADSLMVRCIQHAREKGLKQIRLEAAVESDRAVGLYRRLGFRTSEEVGCFLTMTLVLREGSAGHD